MFTRGSSRFVSTTLFSLKRINKDSTVRGLVTCLSGCTNVITLSEHLASAAVRSKSARWNTINEERDQKSRSLERIRYEPNNWLDKFWSVQAAVNLIVWLDFSITPTFPKCCKELTKSCMRLWGFKEALSCHLCCGTIILLASNVHNMSMSEMKQTATSSKLQTWKVKLPTA